jgi:hypothetical protein
LPFGRRDFYAEIFIFHQYARAFMSAHISNIRPDPDQVLVDIANYVHDYVINSSEA